MLRIFEIVGFLYMEFYFSHASLPSFSLQPDGCKLPVLLTFRINSSPIWHMGKQLLIIRP